MTPHDFEQQLKRQTLRPPPEEWRKEILQAARDAARQEVSVSAPIAPRAPGWREWRAWLWPNPQAWAGLAAAWMLILGLLATGQPRSFQLAGSIAPGQVSTNGSLLAQRRELVRLLDGSPEPEAPPKTQRTGPRSEAGAPNKV